MIKRNFISLHETSSIYGLPILYSFENFIFKILMQFSQFQKLKYILQHALDFLNMSHLCQNVMVYFVQEEENRVLSSGNTSIALIFM